MPVVRAGGPAVAGRTRPGRRSRARVRRGRAGRAPRAGGLSRYQLSLRNWSPPLRRPGRSASVYPAGRPGGGGPVAPAAVGTAVGPIAVGTAGAGWPPGTAAGRDTGPDPGSRTGRSRRHRPAGPGRPASHGHGLAGVARPGVGLCRSRDRAARAGLDPAAQAGRRLAARARIRPARPPAAGCRENDGRPGAAAAGPPRDPGRGSAIAGDRDRPGHRPDSRPSAGEPRHTAARRKDQPVQPHASPIRGRPQGGHAPVAGRSSCLLRQVRAVPAVRGSHTTLSAPGRTGSAAIDVFFRGSAGRTPSSWPRSAELVSLTGTIAMHTVMPSLYYSSS